MSSLSRLRGAYFNWLAAQMRAGNGHQQKTYVELLHMFFDTEFVWFVPNDDNRLLDGLELRHEFFSDNGTQGKHDPDVFGACSMLEVLIALSRRMEFFAGGSPEGWAWQLLVNLELQQYSDPLTRSKRARVEDVLHALIWRTYESDGSGGFFPLGFPAVDQRKVELWYQMSAYVEEIHPEY